MRERLLAPRSGGGCREETGGGLCSPLPGWRILHSPPPSAFGASLPRCAGRGRVFARVRVKCGEPGTRVARRRRCAVGSARYDTEARVPAVVASSAPHGEVFHSLGRLSRWRAGCAVRRKSGASSRRWRRASARATPRAGARLARRSWSGDGPLRFASLDTSRVGRAGASRSTASPPVELNRDPTALLGKRWGPF